jgi:hypothetical protein
MRGFNIQIPPLPQAAEIPALFRETVWAAYGIA